MNNVMLCTNAYVDVNDFISFRSYSDTTTAHACKESLLIHLFKCLTTNLSPQTHSAQIFTAGMVGVVMCKYWDKQSQQWTLIEQLYFRDVGMHVFVYCTYLCVLNVEYAQAPAAFDHNGRPHLLHGCDKPGALVLKSSCGLETGAWTCA